MSDRKILIVSNIKLPVSASVEEAFCVARKKLASAGLSVTDAAFRVYKRSIDARKKNEICFVYSVAAEGGFPDLPEEVMQAHGIRPISEKSPVIVPGSEVLSAPPVVVGTGPCGLFAALLLAEAGYRPTLLERGGSISERKEAKRIFETTRRLDPDCNIQFGAGGAGTFSDGKLITRIGDDLSAYVLRRFCEFGAGEEILTAARPHIGTDVLSGTVEKILSHIESCGGKILFHTQYISPIYRQEKLVGIQTSRGDIDCGALILALGHSARDTYAELQKGGFSLQAKRFSVGFRVEHLAEEIDAALYGRFAGDPRLGHAEYNLSYNTRSRGIYTFCMCPGGEVVAAASEEGGVVVNGMSCHARAGKNSNSAVAATVFTEDYGGSVEGAIAFQRSIEQAAFRAGGSDYSAPVTTLGDFLAAKPATALPSAVLPTYMGGGAYRLASPDAYLPAFLSSSIRDAFADFDRKIPGFSAPYAVLTGPETRTSAPIRILRDQTTGMAIGFDAVYPAGEGAGYAGGITSAAIDGIKTAETLIRRFSPALRG